MERESQSATEMGMEIMLGAFLLISAVVLYLFGKGWYADQQVIESKKEDIAIITTAYSMTCRDVATGADIIEFIIKCGENYNYVVYNDLYNPHYINQANVKNQEWIWTSHYLATSVFGSHIDDNYQIKVNRRKDGSGEIVSFEFTLVTALEE